MKFTSGKRFAKISQLWMGLRPGEVLFVDDNIDNIKRAGCEGMKVIHFRGISNFKTEIEKEPSMRGNQKEEWRSI